MTRYSFDCDDAAPFEFDADSDRSAIAKAKKHARGLLQDADHTYSLIAPLTKGEYEEPVGLIYAYRDLAIFERFTG